MIDYFVSNRTEKITRNYFKSKEKFCDLYYFHRHNDTWLIDKIENVVRIQDVYKAKHIIEN